MPEPKYQSSRPKIDRLIIVSNRLPINLVWEDVGGWKAQPSLGGLVTALTPILRERGGLWVGWPGISEDVDLGEATARVGEGIGCELRPVMLTEEEINQYYLGFSNEIIWPLFHDLQNLCNFAPAYWKMYQAVNHKFADVVARDVRKNDYVWVHDYHLMLMAKELRRMSVDCGVGFFLHIPFPPLDIFMKLPWRYQILEALLEYDLLGFQTARDRSNFIHCLEALSKGYRHDARRQVFAVAVPGREVKIGSFPISIDFDGFVREASDSLVANRAKELREAMPGRQIILGVDRLDYSKGIPQKLRAFADALERFDDLHDNVTLVQVVVPSREDIPRYKDLKAEVEGLVSEINGRFTRSGWVPIHYMFRSLERTELLAYYRAAEIALVTPLKDGMNLVAKEYCAAKLDRNGVLILSEFAGAATQLRRSSLLVNPYDIEGVADAIYQAYSMGMNERRWRMRRLRRSIRKRDIFWWADSILREVDS
ncbi:MAG: trehalose-6-phosphate synthase [Dehalococcoidia bacterium]|nr:trehalose-6-phosphate synthase [Dehalococcoidia bacterium]